MSETEAFKGKLKEFSREQGETLVQYVMRFIKDKGRDVPEHYSEYGCSEEDAACMFYDVFYKNTGVLVNNTIYEIVTMRSFEYDDMFEANRCQDGSIDFTIKYYNGGCSFSEALERAFSNIK